MMGTARILPFRCPLWEWTTFAGWLATETAGPAPVSGSEEASAANCKSFFLVKAK